MGLEKTRTQRGKPVSAARKIKVLHVIARLNIGGAAIYVIQLASRLNAEGYDCKLICGQVGKSEGDMSYIADEQHLPFTVIPSLGREISLTGDLLTVYRLWRLIRQERPDIVHTHTAKAGFVGRIAARLAGVPVIVHTFHGHVFDGYFSPLKTRLFLWLERICGRLSTRIITLSAGLKRELAEVYRVVPVERIDVIELGFELEPLQKTMQITNGTRDDHFRKQFGIPQDAPLIGIVGRLVPIKNHDLFLSAAKPVLEALPTAYFTIVGDGERRLELETLAQSLGIAQRIIFTGWIKTLPPVYAALDALVLCSRNEGLPVSLIEAMAAGVPVVATDVGGVSDLLEGGRLGKIVPLDRPQALADAILDTLRQSSKIVDLARTAALERYDIGRSADCTAALYQRLMQERMVQKPHDR